MGQLGSDSRSLWGQPRLDQLSQQDQPGPPTLQAASPRQELPMTTPSAMPGAPGPYMPGAPGPYVQTPYGQPPQPPKKRRTWLIVLLVILAVMLIGLVSCGALIGAAGKAITEGTTGASQSQQAGDDRNSITVPDAQI